MKDQNELFIIEHIDNGEWLDTYDAGGYSVYTTVGEAQDALEDEDNPEEYNIVRFVRESNAHPVSKYWEQELAHA